MLNIDNVKIDIGNGYRLSISQDAQGLSYSNRKNGTVEIAVFDENDAFVKLSGHDPLKPNKLERVILHVLHVPVIGIGGESESVNGLYRILLLSPLLIPLLLEILESSLKSLDLIVQIGHHALLSPVMM